MTIDILESLTTAYSTTTMVGKDQEDSASLGMDVDVDSLFTALTTTATSLGSANSPQLNIEITKNYIESMTDEQLAALSQKLDNKAMEIDLDSKEPKVKINTKQPKV